MAGRVSRQAPVLAGRVAGRYRCLLQICSCPLFYVWPSTRKRVTSGFACIANDDPILFEHYQYRRSDRDRFISRSTAKSIAAMLIEIAISEGTIKSVDDAAQTYVPGFKNTEYGKTPIGGTPSEDRNTLRAAHRALDCSAAAVNASVNPRAPGLRQGSASISVLATTVGKFTNKDRVPSSAAIPLPTSVLATKFRLLAGLGGTTKVADITKRFGA
jgi:hypothetical protein